MGDDSCQSAWCELLGLKMAIRRPLTDGEASVEEEKKTDPISTSHPFRDKVMLCSGPLLPWAFILRGPLVFFLRPMGEKSHMAQIDPARLPLNFLKPLSDSPRPVMGFLIFYIICRWFELGLAAWQYLLEITQGLLQPSARESLMEGRVGSHMQG